MELSGDVFLEEEVPLHRAVKEALGLRLGQIREDRGSDAIPIAVQSPDKGKADRPHGHATDGILWGEEERSIDKASVFLGIFTIEGEGLVEQVEKL